MRTTSEGRGQGGAISYGRLPDLPIPGMNTFRLYCSSEYAGKKGMEWRIVWIKSNPSIQIHTSREARPTVCTLFKFEYS